MKDIIFSLQLVKVATLFFLIVLITGCGGNMVLMNPDYQNEYYLSKDRSREYVKVIQVHDQRENPTNVIGTAQVGMFNRKVPYRLDCPVSEFVETSINQMINKRSDVNIIHPITVHIDTFNIWEKTGLFSESGHFKCNLRFLYPVSKDSIRMVKVGTHKIYKGVDVTSSIKKLIYLGLSECTNSFLNDYDNSKEKYLLNISDTTKSNQLSQTYDELFYGKNKDIKINTIYSEPPLKSPRFLCFSYFSGEKVQRGFDISYQTFSPQSNKQYEVGFGYGLTFHDIKNLDRNLEGSFVSFGSPLTFRYYASSNPASLYFGGSLKLTFGTEKIDYGTKEDTKFFFGPTFEESIGLSIEKKLQLEAGLYQIKHFGSNLLPSDIGLKFSLNIGF